MQGRGSWSDLFLKLPQEGARNPNTGELKQAAIAWVQRSDARWVCSRCTRGASRYTLVTLGSKWPRVGPYRPPRKCCLSSWSPAVTYLQDCSRPTAAACLESPRTQHLRSLIKKPLRVWFLEPETTSNVGQLDIERPEYLPISLRGVFEVYDTIELWLW